MVNLLKLSVTAILFGAIFIVGINAITDAPAYTAHTQNINTTTYPATINLDRPNIISGSVVVSNSSYPSGISATGNYTVDLTTGKLTTTAPSNMTNNSIYKVAFNSGQQSNTLNTIVQIVMALIVAVLGLLLLLREAGIKVF